MKEMRILLTSFSDLAEAQSLARKLVSDGLVACAQLGAPMDSVYRWQGDIEIAEEIPVSFKVLSEKIEECCRVLRQLHSYDCPEIVVVAAEANEEYHTWMSKQ